MDRGQKHCARHEVAGRYSEARTLREWEAFLERLRQ
jgi:hypothetical protein